MKIKSIVYGVGGFDETKPDNNIIQTVYYTSDEEAQLAADAEAATEKAALLDRLGITEEEARLLLS